MMAKWSTNRTMTIITQHINSELRLCNYFSRTRLCNYSMPLLFKNKVYMLHYLIFLASTRYLFDISAYNFRLSINNLEVQGLQPAKVTYKILRYTVKHQSKSTTVELYIVQTMADLVGPKEMKMHSTIKLFTCQFGGHSIFTSSLLPSSTYLNTRERGLSRFQGVTLMTTVEKNRKSLRAETGKIPI